MPFFHRALQLLSIYLACFFFFILLQNCFFFLHTDLFLCGKHYHVCFYWFLNPLKQKNLEAHSLKQNSFILSVISQPLCFALFLLRTS